MPLLTIQKQRHHILKIVTKAIAASETGLAIPTLLTYLHSLGLQ